MIPYTITPTHSYTGMQLEAVWTVFSDHWQQEGIVVACFLFFGPFFVNPKDGCVGKSSTTTVIDQ